MIILGIESSCDDTSAALIDCSHESITVLAETTASQIEVHKLYGGVIPEIAGRKHAEQILPVISTVLEGRPKPDAIAVTTGPGLMTGLLVGTEAAKTLSYLWDVPLISVNHIEGHIYSVLLPNTAEAETPIPSIEFPALCLIVSGGHSEFILMNAHGVYEKIGGTRDDAVGEAFDKVAKMLGLEYPGGPKISKLAETGDRRAILFPRPMIKDDSLDMSLSGLKTAALYWLRDNPLAIMQTNPIGNIFSFLPNSFGSRNTSPTIHDFCASFEQAITDVLVAKTTRAIHTYNPKTLILAGGVSANGYIRTALASVANTHNISYLLPPKKYCMDNATMIAAAGYMRATQNIVYDSWDTLIANPVARIYPPNNI
jgi:N6-L-threonylcarbamoyladenine synthase